VVVPAKTPKEIVAEITGWLTSSVKDPETKRKLVAQGLFPAVNLRGGFRRPYSQTI
jgi:tripartite-type tricarboxylate transporter receptor subunit TctC